MENGGDDGPPLLVNHLSATEEATKVKTSDAIDSIEAKVPITIITGIWPLPFPFVLWSQHVIDGGQAISAPAKPPCSITSSQPTTANGIAVILNEFGPTNAIDRSTPAAALKPITVNEATPAADSTANGRVSDQAQEWLDLANGCICCSVKDSGVAAIEQLMERRGRFDYILLETTGLADPGNLAPVFWLDDGLGSSIYLDGIVTLVDAKNVSRELDRPEDGELVSEDRAGRDGRDHGTPHLTVAHLQISHADVVVVNKTDLVSNGELDAVQARVRAINPLATIHVTHRGVVPQLEGLVLDLNAYDQVTRENLDFASKGHSHLDPRIGTVTLKFRPLTDDSFRKLEGWVSGLLWENRLTGDVDPLDCEIFRAKGRIPIVPAGVKILQAVREYYEFTEAKDEGESKDSTGKIVLIGRDINDKTTSGRLQESLDMVLSSNSS